MKRHKSCETECGLIKHVGQACHSECTKLALATDLYEKRPLTRLLDMKGKK